MKKNEQARRVSLRDVARQAGVSIGTASNVFSGNAWVAPETRLLVTATAIEMGYSPRVSRPTDVTDSKTTTLSFLVRGTPIPLSINPYYAPILNGVEKACSAHGMSLMYSVVDENVEDSSELPLMIQRREVQGILVVDYFKPAFFSILEELGLPFVLVEHKLDTARTDSVTVDDEHGGYLATRYLLEHGHVSPPPAMITAPPQLLSVSRRLAGYRRALNEYGLQERADYVRMGDLNITGGYNEMQALLQLPEVPSAVFCCNDITALGALNALKEHGISVPDQCSLIGYDDIDLAAQMNPPLTTVKSETELLGLQGVWHLLERMKYPQLAARHTLLEVQLIERASVKQYTKP
ncbi:LacI family DNA-binding transcriptional regulator [Dictyobacter alpinus]|nr:LacI family DNA-binding transcriptional regulator [Dictyobacter alpinus]